MQKIYLSIAVFGWMMELTAASDGTLKVGTDDYLNLSNQSIVYDQLVDRVSENITDFGLSIQQKSKPLSSYASKIKGSHKNINLSNNLLSDQGITALADILKDHDRLEYLSIANNNAGGEAIRTLLLAILPLEKLKLVDIRGNFGASQVCIKRLQTQIKEQLGEDQQNLVDKIIWKKPSDDTRTMPWEVSSSLE